MKSVELDRQGPTLEQVLREAAGGEVVVLTAGGEARFALVAIDEADREVMALRSNDGFLAYLDDCSARAKAEPRKSLRAMQDLYGAAATSGAEEAS